MLDIKAFFSGSITLSFFISSVLITTKLVPLTIYNMKLNSFSIKKKTNSIYCIFVYNSMVKLKQTKFDGTRRGVFTCIVYIYIYIFKLIYRK